MFAQVSEDKISCLLESKDSKSTKRTVARSVKNFRNFLDDDSRFDDFPKENLNEKLRLFFASIRKNSGEHLKKSTLVNTRYGISKYLKENCGIDITSDIEFSSCKDVFRAVVVDLKKKGFASTDHKPPIAQEDLVKNYSVDSIVMNVRTPCGLQKKVWFDLMFYLCRRGQENLRSMSKSTFGINTDSSGREFVYQKEDLIKIIVTVQHMVILLEGEGCMQGRAICCVPCCHIKVTWKDSILSWTIYGRGHVTHTKKMNKYGIVDQL